MISYSIHLKHMMDAASHIEKPGKYLYRKIVAFVKAVKKRRYKFRPAWGKIFSFMYAAKFAKTLPYYDRYPLVLVLRRDMKKGYFDGLNLHYVNPYYRTLLLNGIKHLHVAGSDRYLVKEFQETVSKFVQRIFRPCYHRYRLDRVRNMSFVPVSGVLPAHFGAVKDQTFMKSGLQRVWMESFKAITRGFRFRQRMESRKKAKKAAERHAEVHSRNRKNQGNENVGKRKARQDSPSKRSTAARNSKARTGRKYRGKKK